MTREEAVERLKPSIGKDLRIIAEEQGVTVWKDGKKNKGWAGMVVERLLGHPQDSKQEADFGAFELKVVPVVRDSFGRWSVKETMAMTMIEPKNVMETPFEHSHLLEKLRAVLVCARVFKDEEDSESVLLKVAGFDLTDAETFKQVQADYELVRKTLREAGVTGLDGSMGTLIQPRTKGSGKGAKTYAFYARTIFVARILKLNSQ
jgi:DNA mismatch repair protein MutH